MTNYDIEESEVYFNENESDTSNFNVIQILINGCNEERLELETEKEEIENRLVEIETLEEMNEERYTELFLKCELKEKNYVLNVNLDYTAEITNCLNGSLVNIPDIRKVYNFLHHLLKQN